MLLILVAGFLYIRRNNLDFIYNKTLWGLGALVNIFFYLHTFLLELSEGNNLNAFVFSSLPYL